MDKVLNASTAASELTRRLGFDVTPRDVSRAIYDRRIDVAQFPLVSGRRIILPELLPIFEAVLRSSRDRRAGKKAVK